MTVTGIVRLLEGSERSRAVNMAVPRPWDFREAGPTATTVESEEDQPMVLSLKVVGVTVTTGIPRESFSGIVNSRTSQAKVVPGATTTMVASVSLELPLNFFSIW